MSVMDEGAARKAALVKIGVATFGILALELALIRWTSGQIRIFAYFNNLVLIGAFLVRAAYDFNAHEAKGVGGTLRTLAAEPHGAWLLGITALGLIAYGLYDFVLARYRRIH